MTDRKSNLSTIIGTHSFLLSVFNLYNFCSLTSHNIVRNIRFAILSLEVPILLTVQY